jgi:hypothetical protein
MSSNATNIHDKNNNKHVKLLQQFPKIKFSYELKSYKKVSNSNSNTNHYNDDNDNINNVYLLIPKGKKFFVWFKNDESLFLELDNDKQIVNVTSKKPSRIFPNDTLLYGTQFYYRSPVNTMAMASHPIHYYFTIENIHYYNGINLDTTQTVFEKCKTLHLAFTTVTLEKTFQIDIGLPHIDTSLERISAVKPFYQVYCIQMKKGNDTKNQYENIRCENVQQTKQSQQQTQQQVRMPTVAVSNSNASIKYVETSNVNKKYKVFIVSADIQNDIYHLVDPDDSANNNFSNSTPLIASIPDYKTSVMMNALFRNIKENKSLDALEESDDEDEFENTNIDKFVDLTKKLKMKCIFNYKFKKWTPIECAK